MMTTQNEEDVDELLKEELLVSKAHHPNHDARIVAIQLDEIDKDASYSGDIKI